MIIDARLRPPTEEFQSQFKTSGIMVRVPAFPVPDPPSFVNDSVEIFVEEMDEAGITLGVVVGRNRPKFEVTNDSIADVISKYPDKMIGVAGIDPYNESHDAIAEIERCIGQLGLKGISVEPGGNRRPMFPNNKAMYPIYEKCNLLKVPVYLTTGPRQGETIENTRPVYVEEVARDFPELNIVCAHACWPYTMEMLGVAMRCKNIFIIPDLYTYRPGGELYLQAAERYLENQFVYGSAYPLAPLKESVEGVKNYPLKEEVLNKILYQNAARLFEL